MKKLFKLSLLASAVLSSALAGAATNPVLWVTDGQHLSTIDAQTGAQTSVGRQLTATLTDIAFSPDGTLYGIDGNNLYTVSTTNAALTKVGSLGNNAAGFNALTFGTDGTLFAAGYGRNYLYTINTTTGASSQLSTVNLGTQSAGDLAFVDGVLYMAATGGDLVKFNTLNGGVTKVGNPGTFWGLASSGTGALYGLYQTYVSVVDTQTGKAGDKLWFKNISSNNLTGTAGATMAFETVAPPPVPEPESYAMFIAGLGVMAAFARRRKQQA